MEGEVALGNTVFPKHLSFTNKLDCTAEYMLSVYVDCMPLLDEIFNQELDRDLLIFWTENSRAFANLASCVEYSRIPVDRP